MAARTSAAYALGVGAALILLSGACSSTKSIPEDAYLYKGAELDWGEDKKLATGKVMAEAEGALSPSPNSRILGLPLRRYLYQLFDNGKEKGLLPWARDKLGQAPVLLDESYVPKVEKVVANRLFNNGYFDGQVEGEVVKKDQKAKVIYHLDLREPYRIDSLSRQIDHPTIGPLIERIPPSEKLRPGQVYTLSAVQAEAARIEEQLKRKGYYFFSKDYLLFQVDSTHADRKVALRLKLKPEAPPSDLRPYYIRDIEVFPDYDRTYAEAYEEETYQGISFLFRYRPHRFRLRPLADQILFRPGDRYRLRYHHNSLKRLVNLNTFSFVNIQYERIPDTDSLDMFVSLTPKTSQNLEGSIGLAYKNSQYLSPEAELIYTNRNLFKGSENLRLRVFTNLNFPVGDAVGNFYEKSGIEATLSIPGLKLPLFGKSQYRQLNRANTRLNILFQRERATLPLEGAGVFLNLLPDDQFPAIRDELGRDSSYAPFIGVNSLEATFGYQWQRKPHIRHEFNPLGIGVQFGTFGNEELKQFLTILALFEDLLQAIVDGTLSPEDLENLDEIIDRISEGQLDEELEQIFGSSLNLLLQLEDMIYWRPNYTFLFDSREKRLKRHNYFYRGRLSFIGNAILPDPNFQFFTPQSLQSYYLQTENDFRYFYIFPRKKHSLAARLVVDVSYPFGAELFLPFLNLFSVAGPNSVRAYALRELGPGTLQLNEEGNALTLFAGRGDVHIESSIEYRHKLTSLFELAAFADVGNVWVLRSFEDQANFRFDSFYRELGFGVGLGLRLNINPLVLRLDVAMPLTKPWLPEGERWVGNQIDFFYGGWRKDNLQFNLSFGYPF